MKKGTKICNFCGQVITDIDKSNFNEFTYKGNGYYINENKSYDMVSNGDFSILNRSNDDIYMQIDRLISENNRMEAIKIYRSATGLGLKESKEAIESYILNKEKHRN